MKKARTANRTDTGPSGAEGTPAEASNPNGSATMSDENTEAPKAPDLHQQQLDALEAASKQQLDALAQQRDMAMESAKYWDNVAKQAAADRPELQVAMPPTPRVSSAVLTEAHFTYLESILKAQVDFVRTLLTPSER
jgi:hypothetical protein